jgi:hypothetical protein
VRETGQVVRYGLSPTTTVSHRCRGILWLLPWWHAAELLCPHLHRLCATRSRTPDIEGVQGTWSAHALSSDAVDVERHGTSNEGILTRPDQPTRAAGKLAWLAVGAKPLALMAKPRASCSCE